MIRVYGVLSLVCLLCGTVLSNQIIDSAVFHVDFGADSVNDTNGNISVGTAQNITFVDTPTMLNSNGRGAYFNGVNSGIDYDLGINNELKINTALTYHVRVKFDRVSSGEQWLMGRFDSTSRVTYVQEYFGEGAITGKWSTTGTSGDGNVSPTNTVSTDGYYDIFFRFMPKSGDVLGRFETLVYDSETGDLVWQSPDWRTGITALADTNTGFWVGLRGDHTGTIPFQGVIDQVNVWNRCLDMPEVEMVVVPEPATLILLCLGSLGFLKRKN